MPAEHLPASAERPPRPLGVLPLLVTAGTVAGQRLDLLSLERWTGWADLRFARTDVGATTRLTRRVPPPDAWHVTADGEPVEVIDAIGRGDRAFSNGEVRLVPAPTPGAQLQVAVTLIPGLPALVCRVRVPDEHDRGASR